MRLWLIDNQHRQEIKVLFNSIHLKACSFQSVVVVVADDIDIGVTEAVNYREWLKIAYIFRNDF